MKNLAESQNYRTNNFNVNSITNANQANKKEQLVTNEYSENSRAQFDFVLSNLNAIAHNTAYLPPRMTTTKTPMEYFNFSNVLNEAKLAHQYQLNPSQQFNEVLVGLPSKTKNSDFLRKDFD